MSNTSKKLDEARFFLEQMQAYWLEEVFSFYLSAFVSAARSVPWIMRKEYSSVPGWKEWYSTVEPKPEVDQMLTKFNDLRIQTTKQQPISSDFHVHFHIPPEDATEDLKDFLSAHQTGKLTFRIVQEDESSNSQDESLPIIESGDARFHVEIGDIYRVVDDFEDDDILDLCNEYLGQLEALVDSCHDLFGDPDS